MIIKFLTDTEDELHSIEISDGHDRPSPEKRAEILAYHFEETLNALDGDRYDSYLESRLEDGGGGDPPSARALKNEVP